MLVGLTMSMRPRRSPACPFASVLNNGKGAVGGVCGDGEADDLARGGQLDGMAFIARQDIGTDMVGGYIDDKGRTRIRSRRG